MDVIKYPGGQVQVRPAGNYMGKAFSASVVMTEAKYGKLSPDSFLEMLAALTDPKNKPFIEAVQKLR
ncbi:hypothetical protein [Methanosarcina acetivorans]|uniref:hypothetical protein n=1 Tax=Methanosarcina acetivorans TaxID=2214 RepID=UPI00064F275A|nr:hypothetical protein [Methanosarcina acetivorans]